MDKLPYNKLPDLPSDLVRTAINDLLAVSGDDAYKIDMNDWHNPSVNNKDDDIFSPKGNIICSVCFAGSVMAKSLGVHPEKDAEPNSFFEHFNDRDTYNKLESLDAFRTGDVKYALKRLSLLEKYPNIGNVEVRDEEAHNLDIFIEDMEKVISVLKENGL